MLYLVHRVTISIKIRPKKLEQAVSESLPHKGLNTKLLGVQLTCLDPVPASICVRNAQEINITNCDVTSWSWVNLVHPKFVVVVVIPGIIECNCTVGRSIYSLVAKRVGSSTVS